MSEVTTATEKRVRRVFMYNGARLGDPDPNMTPMQVKEHYTRQFPEMLNATVKMYEGGTKETDTTRQETWNFEEGVKAKNAPQGQEQVHEIKRNTGTKG